MTRAIEQAPHCDSRVLHAPGTCTTCDAYPEWQALREMWGINFTGQRDSEKLMCPAEWNRRLDNIEAWPGNRSHTD